MTTTVGNLSPELTTGFWVLLGIAGAVIGSLFLYGCLRGTRAGQACSNMLDRCWECPSACAEGCGSCVKSCLGGCATCIDQCCKGCNHCCTSLSVCLSGIFSRCCRDDSSSSTANSASSSPPSSISMNPLSSSNAVALSSHSSASSRVDAAPVAVPVPTPIDGSSHHHQRRNGNDDDDTDSEEQFEELQNQIKSLDQILRVTRSQLSKAQWSSRDARTENNSAEMEKLSQQVAAQREAESRLTKEIARLKSDLEQAKKVPPLARVQLPTLPTQILGSGSTSTVYETSFHGAPVAVKIFHNHVATNKTVQREVKASAHLQHPNITRILALVEDHRGKMITGLLMEKMKGTLADSLSGKPPPSTRQRLQWCLETAQGIFCAHSLGVIHSDIKPENILLSTSNPPVAKLTDFGSAHVLTTNASKVTSARGTPLYIAPEYANGTTGPTKQSDIFSFGMMIWSVLHPGVDHGLGNAPIQTAMNLSSSRRPPIDTSIDHNVILLIQACWHQYPTQRPTIEEVIQTLIQLVANLEGLARMESRISPLWTSEKYLKTNYPAVGSELSKLNWSPGADATTLLFSNDITDPQHPLFQFVASKFRPTPFVQRNTNFPNPNYRFPHRITRIHFVSLKSNSRTFFDLHDDDNRSRRDNSYLNLPPNFFAEQEQHFALEKLRSVFEDPAVIERGSPNMTRILFAWHGTSANNVEKVCRDGVRGFRETDAGFFGAGSYFSLEADYVVQYSHMGGPNNGNEYAMILFALSLSQTYPITLENDYREIEDEDAPCMHGFSNFFSGTPHKSIALTPRCDSHFVPTKNYGRNHPRGQYQVKDRHGSLVPGFKQTVISNVMEQACGAHDPDCVGHEIVLQSHTRALPIAVVYFKS